MTATVSSTTMAASDLQPPPPLDLADALDLLSAVVDDQGPDNALLLSARSGMTHQMQPYARNGEPRCIVGRVLSSAGVSSEELESMGNEPLRDLYGDGRLPIAVTLGALIVLDAAQQSQARGGTWGEVLEDALSATAKFLYLIDALPQVARTIGSCAVSCPNRQSRSREPRPSALLPAAEG